MPTEDDLRDLFASEGVTHSIDPKRVIARSRSRRIPRQIGAGAIGALAIAGISVLGVQTITQQQQTASDSATTMQEYDAPAAGGGVADDAKRMPADRINLCEGPVTPTQPSYSGLVLDVAFPESAPTGTAPVVGAVRLTNTSTATVTGTTAAAPAITLSRDGIVLWHTNGPTIQSVAVVDLAPGASLEYTAFFVPVQCSVADDLEESFPSDLPAVTAGAYELSAAIDFAPDVPVSDVPDAGLELVTGGPEPITLG